MLIGEYRHAMDSKGRLVLPAKIREEIGETFIMTKGLDQCIAAYTLSEWEMLEEKVHALPSAKSRALKRFLFASATEVITDKQGRVLIPMSLREYASLSKNIVTIGNSTGIEIWNEEHWDTVCGEITQEAVEEAMDELGF